MLPRPIRSIVYAKSPFHAERKEPALALLTGLVQSCQPRRKLISNQEYTRGIVAQDLMQLLGGRVMRDESPRRRLADRAVWSDRGRLGFLLRCLVLLAPSLLLKICLFFLLLVIRKGSFMFDPP